MNKRFMRIALVLSLVLAFAQTGWTAPRNIVLMIGDGMGMAHVAAARTALGGPDGRLAMDSMTTTGFVTTHSANSLVTDSAAAGTAYATGTKTNNGTISLTPNGKRVRTILEAARDIGKATGLVTTTAVTDATPASFASHVDARSRQAEIAGQMLAARVNVILGGGRGLFVPKSTKGSARPDERNLLDEAAARGYGVVDTSEELNAAAGPRILGLFAMGNLTTEAPEPPLSALTDKAIEVLSQEPKGFFLMVEGGRIDSYGHSNELDAMIRQLLEFDHAVARALDFARNDGNTLVIVTADHETGGLTLLTDDSKQVKPAWSTKGHTATPVPIYAFGPDAEAFSGLMDNIEVGRKLAALWNVRIGSQDAEHEGRKQAKAAPESLSSQARR